MTGPRLVPPGALPGPEWPAVPFACDARPTHCPACAVAVCQHGMVPGLRPALPSPPPRAA